jgi:hypothetical protein
MSSDSQTHAAIVCELQSLTKQVQAQTKMLRTILALVQNNAAQTQTQQQANGTLGTYSDTDPIVPMPPMPTPVRLMK